MNETARLAELADARGAVTDFELKASAETQERLRLDWEAFQREVERERLSRLREKRPR